MSALVSVEKYLRTSFPDADREYVDGRIVHTAADNELPLAEIFA